jgi:hypothetical protein
MMLLLMKIQKRKNPETLESYGELCFLLSVPPNLSSLKPGPRVHSPPSWIIANFFISMEKGWSIRADGQDGIWDGIWVTLGRNPLLYLLDQLIQTRGGERGRACERGVGGGR